MTNKQAYAGLLPCPFCGSEAALYEGHRDHWKVRCTKCEAMRGRWFAREGAQSKAIDAWNTRPEAAEAISSLLKRVGELEGLISEQSIERLATDIAIACVDCRPEIREARLHAMVRLGERLRKPLANDLHAALNSDAPLSIGEGQ